MTNMTHGGEDVRSCATAVGGRVRRLYIGAMGSFFTTQLAFDVAERGFRITGGDASPESRALVAIMALALIALPLALGLAAPKLVGAANPMAAANAAWLRRCALLAAPPMAVAAVAYLLLQGGIGGPGMALVTLGCGAVAWLLYPFMAAYGLVRMLRHGART